MGGVPPALTIAPSIRLLLCFIGLWWSPFFLGTVVAVWSGARVSMSASWRLVSPRTLSWLLLRRVCRVVFCACGVPPPDLALWRVVGFGVCVEDQHPFPWAFWGACSLGIGEALFLCLWVCLWLSWRHMGWRQTGCFCITTVAYVLSQAQEPPYGVDGAVFRGAVVTTLSSSKGG